MGRRVRVGPPDVPTAGRAHRRSLDVMAAMAQATERLVLGPMVTPIARRRAQVLARQTATLDRLSNGRLVFGVGLGGDPGGELSRFDEEMDAARARQVARRRARAHRPLVAGRGGERRATAAAAGAAAPDPGVGGIAIPEPGAGAASGAVGRLVPDRAHVARRPRRADRVRPAASARQTRVVGRRGARSSRRGSRRRGSPPARRGGWCGSSRSTCRPRTCARSPRRVRPSR